MDRKTFFLSALIIILVSGVATAAYNAYRHSSFTIGDGKDIDLNGQSIGNGTFNYSTSNIIAQKIGGVIYADQYPDVVSSYYAAMNNGGVWYFSHQGSPYNTIQLGITTPINIVCEPDTVIIASLGSAADSGVITVRSDDVSITGCTISGNKSGGNNLGNAIAIKDGVNRTKISNVILKDVGQGALYMATAHHVIFKDSTCYDVLACVVTTSSDDITIENNYMAKFTLVGIDLLESPNNKNYIIKNNFIDGSYSDTEIAIGGIYGSGINHTLVEGNTVQNFYNHSTSGIYFINGGDNRIIGNSIEKVNWTGIDTDRQTGIVIQGNYVNNTNGGNCISYAAPRHGVVTSNILGFCGLNGISITSAADEWYEDNQVFGNVITNTSSKININPGGSILNNSVRDNTGASPYNHGNSAAAPSAFGAGDTYYDTDLSNICVSSAAGTASWLEVKDMTTACT